MRPSVCVLGSANMDLVATVEQVPRLGETVTGTDFLQLPGGKGANQALAAARAGADVRMLGAVGDDAFGAAIRQVLEADGVDTSGLQVSDEPTGTAHILVESGGDNLIVVVPGANGTVRSLNDDHRVAIAAADVLLLQLELPLDVVVEAAVWARERRRQVVLTPAPVLPLPSRLLRAVDLIVPNEHEAARLTGEADPAAASRALLGQGVGAVAVTLGERGCLYTAADTEPLPVPAPRVEVVDSTAAGDTFVGALVVALADGRPAADALRWATAAAALSVQRAGASASMPHRHEIDTFLTAMLSDRTLGDRTC